MPVSGGGDLPKMSGVGSSSAFTVGLLHAMYALRGMMSSKRELACEAIHIERDILKENIYVQTHRHSQQRFLFQKPRQRWHEFL